MADTKSDSKKSSMNPIVGIGIGCLVILFILGIGLSVAMKFFAKKIGTSLVQSAIESKTGIKTNLQDIENGKMTFTDQKTGETVNIGTGTLPSNFPSDFPQYPGAKVASSLSGNKSGSTNGFFVTFSSTDGKDKVTNYYKDQLKSKGWTTQSSMDVGTVTTYAVTKGTWEGTVSISSDTSKKETAIMVTLGEKNKDQTQEEVTDTPEP